MPFKNDHTPAASMPDSSNNHVTSELVLAALSQIRDPDLHKDIVSLGMIKDLKIVPDAGGSAVHFTFELTTPACPVRNQFEASAREAVEGISGVASVHVNMSAQVQKSVSGGNGHQVQLPEVKHVIAVGSGKGGVGKSTVAANLAVALAQSGASVGLLDADVYGPSIPQLMGVHEGIRAEEAKMVPNEAYGVKLISLGFIAGDKPVMWRGPMIGHALKQMLEDVKWGELDYMVVDLPPGTGDAQLSLVQLIPLSGVVIVSTPQDVALGIATKALQMFRQLHVPILGMVENMSASCCPNCGHNLDVFGAGGVQAVAGAMKVPFLGAVPLNPSLRESGDAGIPVSIFAPDSVETAAFESISQKTAAQISIRTQRTIPLVIQ